MTTEDLIEFANHIAQLERVAKAAAKFCEDQHVGSLMALRREVEFLKPPPETAGAPSRSGGGAAVSGSDVCDCGLWHCTLEDHEAACAHLRAVEDKRDELRAALGWALAPEPESDLTIDDAEERYREWQPRYDAWLDNWQKARDVLTASDHS